MNQDLKDLLDNAGFGELDQVQLEVKEEYAEYFRYIKTAFKALDGHLQATEDETIGHIHPRRAVVSYFLTRLLRTVELLNLKYQFDQEHHVKIDATDSSFPNNREIRQIKADYNLKTRFLDQLPNALSLKDQLITHLKKHDEEPYQILDQLSKQKYFSNLFLPSLYVNFNKGRLISSNEKVREWRKWFYYSWSVYDQVTNLPIIYLLKFQITIPDKKDPPEKELLENVKDFIEGTALGTNRIYDIMVTLDNAMLNVHPKQLQKFTVGPLYGHYSQDDHVLTDFHKRHKLNHDSFVLTFEEEILRSASEEQEKGKWFKDEPVLQKWDVKRTDRECLARKISEYKRKFLAPHTTIQLLMDDPKTKAFVQALRDDLIAI